MILNSIIIGSRVYGTPNQDSDWDVVIRSDREDALLFGAKKDGDHIIAPTDPAYELDIDSWHIYIGNIDYILCFTDKRFESFRSGTEKLKLIAPVSRDVAKAVFKDLFKKESNHA